VTIRILLADTHASIRQSLRALIDRQPGMHVVAEAENGQTMLQLTENFRPDVVVMDINMPDLKNIKDVRRVISEAPGVKLLAFSMHANQEYADEMIKAGASGYLLKDYAFEELVQAIQTVADDRTYLCPGLEDSAAPKSG
jgi:DNA-binding NarL/FixJ family response regulator